MPTPPSALGRAHFLSLWDGVQLEAQDTGCADEEMTPMVVPYLPGL